MRVKIPLITESVAHLECKAVSSMKMGDHTIVIGEVVATHVDEEFFYSERLCLNLDKMTMIITRGNA